MNGCLWLLFSRVDSEIGLWKSVKTPSESMSAALNRLKDIVEPWSYSRNMATGEVIPPPEYKAEELVFAFKHVKRTILSEDVYLESILSDIIGDYECHRCMEEDRKKRSISVDEQPTMLSSNGKNDDDDDDDDDDDAVEVAFVHCRKGEDPIVLDDDDDEEPVKSTEDEVKEAEEAEDVLGTPIVGSANGRSAPPLRRVIHTKTITWTCLPPKKKRT